MNPLSTNRWSAFLGAMKSGDGYAVKTMLRMQDITVDDFYSRYNYTNMEATRKSVHWHEDGGRIFRYLLGSPVAGDITPYLTTADVNGQSKHGVSPLMAAAEYGHLHAIDQLLQAGALIDARDSYGRTALFRTTLWRQHEVLIHLLEKGANSNLRDGNSSRPYDIARRNDDAKMAVIFLGNAGTDIFLEDMSYYLFSLFKDISVIVAGFHRLAFMNLLYGDKDRRDVGTEDRKKSAMDILIPLKLDLTLADDEKLTPEQMCSLLSSFSLLFTNEYNYLDLLTQFFIPTILREQKYTPPQLLQIADFYSQCLRNSQDDHALVITDFLIAFWERIKENRKDWKNDELTQLDSIYSSIKSDDERLQNITPSQAEK